MRRPSIPRKPLAVEIPSASGYVQARRAVG